MLLGQALNYTIHFWTYLLAQLRYTDKVYFINGWLILPSSAIKLSSKIVDIKLQKKILTLAYLTVPSRMIT